jgi:hypothetical protein
MDTRPATSTQNEQYGSVTLRVTAYDKGGRRATKRLAVANIVRPRRWVAARGELRGNGCTIIYVLVKRGRQCKDAVLDPMRKRAGFGTLNGPQHLFKQLGRLTSSQLLPNSWDARAPRFIDTCNVRLTPIFNGHAIPGWFS